MNIAIFNHEYTVRRFTEQRFVNGHNVSDFYDFKAKLNVRPASDNVQAQPEGERNIMRLAASGSDFLLASDQDCGVKGDLLFYHGKWYECVSAEEWEHTILRHWEYSFIVVPKDVQGSADLRIPETKEADDEYYYG